MADNTKIEWTDATWTPIRALIATPDGPKIGWHCEHVSEGCRNCYAEVMNRRLGTSFDYKPGHLVHANKWGERRGDVSMLLDEKMLLAPLRWKKPRKVFVCSMTDLFADFVPDEWIDQVFAVMALAPQHTFQVLTKRADRMRTHLSSAMGRIADSIMRVRSERGIKSPVAPLPHVRPGDAWWPLPNVWVGVSVEDQQRADERIPDLLATPAALRFLSCEPLLGPVDLNRIHEISHDGLHHAWESALNGKRFDEWGDGPDIEGCTKIDWVIVGGESGPRPMHPDWVRSLRDQCAEADVPFFFKQWGEWAPVCEMSEELIDACYHPVPERHPLASRRPKRNQCVMHADGNRFDGEAMFRRPAFEQGRKAMTMFAVGKKAAGRLLDGVEHSAFPEVHP